MILLDAAKVLFFAIQVIHVSHVCFKPVYAIRLTERSLSIVEKVKKKPGVAFPASVFIWQLVQNLYPNVTKPFRLLLSILKGDASTVSVAPS